MINGRKEGRKDACMHVTVYECMGFVTVVIDEELGGSLLLWQFPPPVARIKRKKVDPR